MRKVFIALAVIAFGWTAFFAYHVSRHHGDIKLHAEAAERDLAEMKKVVENPSPDAQYQEMDSKRWSQNVGHALDAMAESKGNRNTAAALAAGALVLGVVFVVLSRRKPKATAVA